MKPLALLLLIAMLLPLRVADAQAPAPAPAPAPATPDVAFDQRLGDTLPLSLPFTDSQGHTAALGTFFNDRPVLLVLGYYSCLQLCGLVMQGVIEGLHSAHIPRDGYRIVRVSIDEADTPAIAERRRGIDLSYADSLQTTSAQGSLDLHLLVGSADSIRALASRAGFLYQRNDSGYAHAAAVIVATPQGRISRLMPGVRFDAQELRVALADAAGDRIGSVTSRIALLCAHLDPSFGKYTGSVLAMVRAVCVVLVLLMLAGWFWHSRRPRP